MYICIVQQANVSKMSEIQIMTREAESLRYTMENMEVGEFFTVHVNQSNTVRPYASTLKKFTGKEYAVNRVGDEIKVTRTA